MSNYGFKIVWAGAALLILLAACGEKATEPQSPEPTTDLLVRLNALDGVTAIEVTPQNGYAQRQFQLDITQPLDHDNPAGATFTLRVWLSHIDEEAPVVFNTSGYRGNPTVIQELAPLMEANHVYCSHRFFEDSEPDPMDWTCLTVAQAAADNHRVVEVLKQIYNGVWVSAGHSKSGNTALFHRRFYPDDVVATVAYVAPIPQGHPDPRYIDWLEAQGTQDCRDKMKAYQRAVLKKRDSVNTYLGLWFSNQGEVLSIDTNVVLEWLITEYRYVFWGEEIADCAAVPDSTVSAQELFDHLVTFCWHAFMYSDNWREYYYPWHYQAFTEMSGFYQDTDHLWDLLIDVTPGRLEDTLLCPPGVDITFRPETMQDIHAWLQTEGNNIIYIYGGLDYITAVAMDPDPGTNAIVIVQPGENHGVRLDDLDERELVLSTLEEWTGIELTGD